MNLEELIILFNHEYNHYEQAMAIEATSHDGDGPSVAVNLIRQQGAPDRPCAEYHYKIFPMKCLHLLADEVKSKSFQSKVYQKDHEDFIKNYGARFVVECDVEIKFSLEGPRCRTTPAHTDISSAVLTAGNIIFSEDYSKIVGISNKSGHFQPNFSTLVFALPLILESGFALADQIELKNEQTQETVMLSKNELLDLLPSNMRLKISEMIAHNSLKDTVFEHKSYYTEKEINLAVFSDIENDIFGTLPASFSKEQNEAAIISFPSFSFFRSRARAGAEAEFNEPAVKRVRNF